MGIVTEPLLKNPAPGWKHDLPEPLEGPSIMPHPRSMPNPPNHIDDNYLELACSTVRTRGISVWISIMTGIIAIINVTMFSEYLYFAKKLHTIVTLSLLISIPTFVYLSIFMWRLDTTPPRDEPIRFNRTRRKVYVYRFHYAALRAFNRKAWFTRAEVYDWDDLRAEACSIYGPAGSGGLIETVSLAVVKPGTNEVLDRFHFAHGGLQGEMYWALAQIYMQQGPEALPKFDRPPRDWNNEKITFNLARYLAPKVKWPEAMDLESRTAPDQPPQAALSGHS